MIAAAAVVKATEPVPQQAATSSSFADRRVLSERIAGVDSPLQTVTAMVCRTAICS